jgi:FMN-dependent NADH-azoreductase
MPTLLHLDSSPLESSITRELTREFVKNWQAKHPTGKVLYRDAAASVLPLVDASWVQAAYTPEEARSAGQQAVLAVSNELIAELFEADEYVFGVAMHNFSVSATLKLWIDQVTRVGKTFAYTEAGPRGLLVGKKATLLTASGGNYAEGTPMSAMNFADPYLKTVLGFLGVTDVRTIATGGVAQIMSGATSREALLQPSIEQIRTLTA